MGSWSKDEKWPRTKLVLPPPWMYLDLDGWSILLGAGKIVLSQYTSPIPSHGLSQHLPGGSHCDVRVLQFFASLGTPGLLSCVPCHSHTTCSPPLPLHSWSPLTESLLQGPVFALPFSLCHLWPCGSLVVQFCAYKTAALEPPRYTQSPLPALTADSWQPYLSPLFLSRPGFASATSAGDGHWGTRRGWRWFPSTPSFGLN